MAIMTRRQTQKRKEDEMRIVTAWMDYSDGIVYEQMDGDCYYVEFYGEDAHYLCWTDLVNDAIYNVRECGLSLRKQGVPDDEIIEYGLILPEELEELISAWK